MNLMMFYKCKKAGLWPAFSIYNRNGLAAILLKYKEIKSMENNINEGFVLWGTPIFAFTFLFILQLLSIYVTLTV